MSAQRPEVDRPTGISLSGKIRRRDSFLDHPLYIAGAVLFGILLGVGVMAGTTVARRMQTVPAPAQGIDIVVDGNTNDPVPSTSPI